MHRSHERLDAIQAGAAFFDFNGNGMPDIFFTNANGPNALYRNNGDGTFTDIAEEVGVADPDAMSVGVACADYDNDGNCDLLVTTMTGLKLYHNEGNGTFTDVSEQARLVGYQGHPTSAAWVDFDGDGLLDLYVTYWLDEMPDDDTLAFHTTVSQLKGVYTPLSRTHRLFQNMGRGRFRDVTSYLRSSGIHGAGLALGFFDYDDDGLPDLYVVNDFGQFVQPNILYRNVGRAGDGGWLFADVTEKAGVGAAFHGMGLAVGDYDGDGRLDMFVTNMGDNVLYRNRGNGKFVETNNRAGVTRGLVEGKESVGWGTAFLDFDNNGFLDLYFVAGTPLSQTHGQWRISSRSAQRSLQKPWQWHIRGHLQRHSHRSHRMRSRIGGCGLRWRWFFGFAHCKYGPTAGLAPQSGQRQLLAAGPIGRHQEQSRRNRRPADARIRRSPADQGDTERDQFPVSEQPYCPLRS